MVRLHFHPHKTRVPWINFASDFIFIHIIATYNNYLKIFNIFKCIKNEYVFKIRKADMKIKNTILV